MSSTRTTCNVFAMRQKKDGPLSAANGLNEICGNIEEILREI